MFRTLLAASLLVLSVGCARTVRGELAIYDWEAQRTIASAHGAHDLRCSAQACPDPRAGNVYVLDAPKLTSDDLDRGSTRADVDPQIGGPVVLMRLTAQGRDNFERLTRSLARRGARLKTPQHFLVVVDDVVYASPYIDYRLDPNGIPGDNGIQLSANSLDEARRLAKALRG